MSFAPTTESSERQPAASATTELLVTGMTCNNCARHVTGAIQGVPGVRHAAVMLEAGRASVHWTPGANADVDAVLRAVKAAGYSAKPVEAAGRDHAEHRQTGWQLNLWIGALATLALVVGEWIFNLGMVPWFRWLAFALAGVVQIFAGARFYRGAWNQLKVGSSNMDTLVALGSTTAFGYSAWVLLSGAGGHVYFMEAAAIITLISFGHWLEARVSARASRALKALLHLAPQTARKLETNFIRWGERPREPLVSTSLVSFDSSPVVSPHPPETEVPVAELKVDDLVVLRPGDRVPTDGAVTEGESAVDEAMLTGESLPVDKAVGSELYAGTVNLNGWLVMRVTATGEATALANIIAAVQRAQTSRANIQRLGDRVSSVFVPVVVLVAAATALWWGLAPEQARAVHDWLSTYLWHAHPPATALAAAFIGAAAVLIVACPCAMGLATPAAIMAGSNAAARRGILIRDGVALEKAGTVTAVLFDKTGTLTAGKPTVAKVWEAARAVAAEVTRRTDSAETPPPHVGSYALAAALASHSTHPLSQAVAKLGTADVSFADFREIRGAGVQATARISDFGFQITDLETEECPVRLGSLRWLEQMGVKVRDANAFVDEWSARGATVLGFALEKKLAAAIAIQDALKPGAGEVVRQLKESGLKVYLVTGDSAATATHIAKQAGIPEENVFAEVRPERKADLVRKLQGQGERVAFVGDGINDAPALEQADLGLAVSRASDIAREAADIILLKSEIEAVPEALGLARATLRTIKQNLFWAFFYNAVSVPLAALGFMSPILCAAAMGMSDLLVIGNALRLLRRSPAK